MNKLNQYINKYLREIEFSPFLSVSKNIETYPNNVKNSYSNINIVFSGTI